MATCLHGNGHGKGHGAQKHCGGALSADELDGALIVSHHHERHANANRLALGFGALLIAGIVVWQRRRWLIPA